MTTVIILTDMTVVIVDLPGCARNRESEVDHGGV